MGRKLSRGDIGRLTDKALKAEVDDVEHEVDGLWSGYAATEAYRIRLMEECTTRRSNISKEDGDLTPMAALQRYVEWFEADGYESDEESPAALAIFHQQFKATIKKEQARVG